MQEILFTISRRGELRNQDTHCIKKGLGLVTSLLDQRRAAQPRISPNPASAIVGKIHQRRKRTAAATWHTVDAVSEHGN